MNKTLTWVEIDLTVLGRNLQIIHQTLSPQTKMVVVVKSDAYGHGLKKMIVYLQTQGIDYIAVSGPSEASRCRRYGYVGNIIVLYEHPILAYPASILSDPKIIIIIGSLEMAMSLSKYSVKHPLLCSQHIEVDLGIGKSGLPLDSSVPTIQKIKSMAGLSLTGLMAHLADAESKNQRQTNIDLNKFQNLIDELSSLNINFDFIHVAASTAILDIDTSHYNMVRAGAAVYGLQSSTEKKYTIEVKPCLTWKTTLIRLRTLKQGQNIGYGREYLPKDTLVGIIPVGYAMGLHKPHQKYVSIDDTLCPLMGVNMSESYIDLNNLPNAKAGDVVTLVGDMPQVNAQEIAASLNTVSENIVTAISTEVTRRYL